MLPSQTRFQSSFHRCNTTFQGFCVGPARPTYTSRMRHSWMREEQHFHALYISKLTQALLVISVIWIVVFRFLVKSGLGELLGWALFVVVELAPKMAMFGQENSLWSSQYGKHVLNGYEMVVYNPLWDLNESWLMFVTLLSLGFICSKFRHKVKQTMRVVPEMEG